MCGCPLEPDFPSKLSECKKFCRNFKKSCLKHYCWEKLRRAEIDQEKLNLVSRVDGVKFVYAQLYIQVTLQFEFPNQSKLIILYDG